jgi:hypothetical protein
MARVAAALLLIFTLAGGGNPKAVIVYFLCNTGPSAVQMVEGLLWEKPNEMPEDCRIVEQMRPYNHAIVLEHFALVHTPDGRIAEVARVLRDEWEYGYSAGFTDLLLM